MSDRNTDESGEQLFDTDSTDAATDAADDTQEEGEQKQDDLDLPEKEVKAESSKAEENKQKQLEAWKKKIVKGDKTLDDLPVNLAWLKPELEKVLEVKEEVEKVDVQEMVRKEILVEKEKVKFQSLREELNAVLDTEKKEALSIAYKRLLDKGLSQLDSLETGMEVVGVDLDEMGIDARRMRMQIPKPGRKGKTSTDLGNVPYSEANKVQPSRQKRIEQLQKWAEPARDR